MGNRIIDIYPAPKNDIMLQREYDSNQNLVIDEAEKLISSDRSIVMTAEMLQNHMSDRSIHIEIDDEHERVDAAYSSHKINDTLLDYAKKSHRHLAIEIDTDVDDFGNLISKQDNTVQKALSTLDKAVIIDTQTKCGIIRIHND